MTQTMAILAMLATLTLRYTSYLAYTYILNKGVTGASWQPCQGRQVACKVAKNNPLFPEMGQLEMEVLKDFKCPANCKKLVHRWRDRQRLPDVKEL